jgi:hypothetical protein
MKLAKKRRRKEKTETRPTNGRRGGTARTELVNKTAPERKLEKNPQDSLFNLKLRLPRAEVVEGWLHPVSVLGT